jgi:hypothetical protein
MWNNILPRNQNRFSHLKNLIDHWMNYWIARLLLHDVVYWTHNICEPELRHSKREGKMERARGEKDTLCAVASPPSPYLGWLANDACICQWSSEISFRSHKPQLSLFHEQWRGGSLVVWRVLQTLLSAPPFKAFCYCRVIRIVFVRCCIFISITCVLYSVLHKEEAMYAPHIYLCMLNVFNHWFYPDIHVTRLPRLLDAKGGEMDDKTRGGGGGGF